ncbi:MAG: NAD-dependent epimerase/dehydratase family protein [Nitrospiraceae bacterium]|nr:MAG: NAD-dependent epimerase/dehydratase family protein [Nitrospiraceae bacterium]
MKKETSKLEGSNVLVTGGCGFIGSHLIRRLIDLHVGSITVIDSLKYGDKANIGKESENIIVIKYTIDNKNDDVLYEALHGIDYLFHLAAEKHNQSINNPTDVINSNINGTFRLYEAAARNRVRKVVYASSLYAYGRMSVPDMNESELPAPKTIYGISKLAGELFLAHYLQKNDLKYNVLRYFFTYGPKQFSGTGYKSVIVKNFERILRNENPIIFGDGKQVLDYIYIDDVISATIKAMESDCYGEVFNVGSSIPSSIDQVTDVMLRVSGKSLDKLYDPPDETKDTYRVADISKIKKILNIQPTVSLEEGLSKTYEWIQQRGNV